ncbi:aKG-HExxH-type peptide beta-hydroxylase [Pseudomonas sp. NPDC089530]|uniref:aKG-HExxH-type peptide beta-hydroxylase n=1 Tax=Pseudomonas sp. NPDC089530 TaxID=3390651 RepID=UPI003D072AF7
MDIGNHGQHDSTVDYLFQDTTFLPDTEPSRFELLLQLSSRSRYTVFTVLYAELFKLFSALPHLSEFFEQAADLIVLPQKEQYPIINDPVFQVWSGLAFHHANRVFTEKAENTQTLEEVLLEFPEMLLRIEAKSKLQGFHDYPPVYRFDIDPLIMQATPPSYEFPEDESVRKELLRAGVSTHFFSEVVHVALSRIEQTWPACRDYVQQLVKAICYLPDGTFRSCSASRYTGVILLANRDDSILDLEESLVHEATHQLLYNVVEVCPVTVEGASRDASFSLPWSGQKRDLYGYFHAFYVYIALVKYMERVRSRPSDEVQRAQKRLAFILRGLIRALPDLEASDDFTPHGRQLLDNLAREVRALASKHTGLLAKAAPLPEQVLGATA